MIILEGPDGGGKTTLLKELQAHYGFDIAPRVVSSDAEAMTDLQVWTEQNVRLGFQWRFFDRHRLISEFIYGPILRRDAEPGFTRLDWTGAMLQAFYKLRPVTIYCIPPIDVVRHNLAEDADNLRVLAYTDQIYQSYLERAWLDVMLNPNATIYDYTRDGAELDHPNYLIRLIDKALKENR